MNGVASSANCAIAQPPSVKIHSPRGVVFARGRAKCRGNDGGQQPFIHPMRPGKDRRVARDDRRQIGEKHPDDGDMPDLIGVIRQCVWNLREIGDLAFFDSILCGKGAD